MNFSTDVGIYTREPLLNFYPSRKNLRLTQGSYSMALKTVNGKTVFSSWPQRSITRRCWVRSPHPALSSRAEGRDLYFPYENFTTPKTRCSFPSLFSLLTSQIGRHLTSSLITCPNEMSAANAQVFNCCWNACRCQ